MFPSTNAQKGNSMAIDTLTEWLDQEEALRAVLDAGAGPGVARPDQVQGRTGLELMQAMLRGEVPYAVIAKTLDFMLLEVDDGRAVFQGTPGAAHLNPMGGIHGGWYATLLDSALGCAVHTKMPPRAGLHHRRTQREYREGHQPRQGTAGAGHRPGDPLRPAAGHGRCPSGGRGWHALRARYDHLPGVRHASLA